jgi:hypothetical protein
MSKQKHLNTEDRRGYQWPASALTGKEMAILASWRDETGESICELLRPAVRKVDKLIVDNKKVR